MQVAIKNLADKVVSAIYEPVQRLEDIGTYVMPNGEEWSSVRDLYEYLQLAPAAFTRWCSTNIEKNAFAAQTADYERINLWVDNPSGGRKSLTEYAVHPDFGAKLCMVATRSARAEEVRNFFVARNKKLAAIEQGAMSASLVPAQSPLAALAVVLQGQLTLVQSQLQTEGRVAAVEAEQAAAKQQLAAVQQQVAEVAAKQTTIEEAHYTVAAWARKNGYNRTREELNVLGRRASKLSKEQGYSVGHVYDAKYITVGSYHVDILAQVLPPATSLAKAA